MNRWKIVEERIREAGWGIGVVPPLPDGGFSFWIVEARRGTVRHRVQADDLLTAFLLLEEQLRLYMAGGY